MGEEQSQPLKAKTSRPHGRLARFIQNRCGATLVEFSLIASVFLFFLFAVTEISLTYWAILEVEHASEEVARMVRTGTVQGANGTDPMDQEKVKEEICNRMAMLNPSLASCKTRLRIDLRAFGGTPAPGLDDDGQLAEDSEFEFSPGGPDEVILVTAYYEWFSFGPLPLVGSGLGAMGNGNILLRATTLVTNEPFPTPTS